MCIKKLFNILIALSVTSILIGMSINKSSADLNEGLIAYYPFNGNANDESGNGNHGTVYGATLTEDRFGNPDCAYGFDGVDDYIHIGAMGVTPQFGTIAFWIYPTSVDNYRNPFSTYIYGDNTAIRFEEGFGILSVYIGSSQTNYKSPAYDYIHANNYYYIVFSWDKERDICEGWLNGVKKFEVTHTLWPSEFINVGIGTGWRSYSDRWFKGTIDEVRIYTRILSETEIQQLADWPATISPAIPDFGNIAIGCSSIQTFTMTSVSDSDVEVGTISITGPNESGFKVQNDNCSSNILESTETCTFEVVFKPESIGSKEGTLSITFNTPSIKTVELPIVGMATEACRGDFDSDGDVDGSDLSIFTADFGRTDCCESDMLPCEGDFNGDCDVDGSDLALFATDFGRSDCPFSPQ